MNVQNEVQAILMALYGECRFRLMRMLRILSETTLQADILMITKAFSPEMPAELVVMKFLEYLLARNVVIRS